MWRTRSRVTVHGVGRTVAIAITGVEHKFEHKSCLTIGSEQLLGHLSWTEDKTSPDTRTVTTNKGERTRREAQRKGADANTHGVTFCQDVVITMVTRTEKLSLWTPLRQSICVQLKLDVPRHGISQQEQPKNIIDVHSSRRRSSSKELSHNHWTDYESPAQHLSHTSYHIRSEHFYLSPEGCGLHMRRLEGCGPHTKRLLPENAIDFHETNQQDPPTPNHPS